MMLRMTQYYVVFLPKIYKLNLVTRKHQAYPSGDGNSTR